jgi:L-2-hydroxyglutarate oxidase LhgO
VERLDAVVIGAGVVGLACARALALAGREVMLLEAAAAVGTGASSRSSEVVHAGIYYTPGSFKARMCVAGRQLLYAYCDAHQIPYRRCGKLIVATTEPQLPQLSALAERARANGVADLRLLSRTEAGALEPELRCVGALESPASGILDSHAFMSSLHGELGRAGGVAILRSPVLDGRLERGGVILRAGGAEGVVLRARVVINAAGLDAQAVARSIKGVPAASIPPLYLAKGSYFTLSGHPPFTRLVYPLPSAGGLGVHATIDLAGRVRFGPDVEWVDAIDYRVDPGREAAFYAAVRHYWPELPDGALMPAYAGIRPKLERPGGASTDFIVQHLGADLAGGLINLYGIDSPGLTASLALAEYVAGLAAGENRDRASAVMHSSRGSLA